MSADIDSVAFAWCRAVLGDEIERLGSILRSGNEAEMIPEFSAAARAFRSLGPDDQRAFLAFLRGTSTDAVSIVLASLDGNAAMNGIDKEFSVHYGGMSVSGRLQEAFLSTAEDHFP